VTLTPSPCHTITKQKLWQNLILRFVVTRLDFADTQLYNYEVTLLWSQNSSKLEAQAFQLFLKD